MILDFIVKEKKVSQYLFLHKYIFLEFPINNKQLEINPCKNS